MARLFCFCLLYLVLLVFTGVTSDCPIEISPPSLMVKYGGSALATCRALTPIQGMGWESTVGGVSLEEGVTELNWMVKELKEWTVKLQCFINTEDYQCAKELPVVVYKMPESVSLNEEISKPKNLFTPYTFGCHVGNIAPVQNVTVKWFRGKDLLTVSTDPRDVRNGLQNKTFQQQIMFSKQDDGKEYSCEAGLEFISDPSVQSQPVRISVHYPPDHGDSEVEVVLLEGETKLNCTVSGNPLPEYVWAFEGTSNIKGKQPILGVNQAGIYLCDAYNNLGTSRKYFRVESRSTGTFWSIIAVGVSVAVLLMVGYGIYKCKSGPNSII